MPTFTNKSEPRVLKQAKLALQSDANFACAVYLAEPIILLCFPQLMQFMVSMFSNMERYFR